MLSNVINLGAEPVCAHDLQQAMSAIYNATAAGDFFGYGRALLSAQAANATCKYSAVIIMQNGTLSLETADGIALKLLQGDIANVPAGDIRWSAENADCVIILLHHDNPELTLTKLDLSHPMSEGGGPNPALLTSAVPETARHEFYDTDELSWGTWRTTPYTRRPLKYTFSEIMALRSGEVTFDNPEESSVTFSAGDIFLVRPDAVASWNNPVNLEKFWLIRTA